MSCIDFPEWVYAQEKAWIAALEIDRCQECRNQVLTWFLSGVWRCFNLLKRSLHSRWGVISVFCGSQSTGHHQMPSAFVILTQFKTRSIIPVSMCAERCGIHSAGCFVSLNALKQPSVFMSIPSVISVLSQCAPTGFRVRYKSRTTVWDLMQDYIKKGKT